jgi:hypothetical protein
MRRSTADWSRPSRCDLPNGGRGPLWGAPRIHGELLKLGFSVSQSTVSKCLSQTYRPRGQTWGTFVANRKDAIAAIDLFVVPTIDFKLQCGLAILHLGRRELVWTNATANPTAEWMARQITEAFPWKSAEVHASRSRRLLWRCVWTPARRDGHSRPSRCAQIAVAERICRARDRLDPARVHRSHDRHGRRASAPDAQIIRALLQPGADTLVARQRRSDSSADPSAWEPIRDSASRRPSS